MLIFVLILIIILFLFIIPVPVKLKILYRNGKFNMYIYNVEVFEKLLKNQKKEEKKVRKSYLENLSSILSSLKNNKLKPVIKLNINFIFGFDDAAYTAIVYGVLCSSYSALRKLLNIVFKIKKFHVNITPNLNKSICDLELNSIISISLVKIIYMKFII
ncbi:DUF2953 domain-containing protein [Clostridium sp. JN-1]|uniref:DUF2953 domain-containing protein n=1 Tax=Clostridium sp. JN-1 TaxID=2483110 RepID=UPI000F0B7A4E|nr:DUF2953 domain-containing protein [Clostridium sp. JN-1]